VPNKKCTNKNSQLFIFQLLKHIPAHVLAGLPVTALSHLKSISVSITKKPPKHNASAVMKSFPL